MTVFNLVKIVSAVAVVLGTSACVYAHEGENHSTTTTSTETTPSTTNVTTPVVNIPTTPKTPAPPSCNLLTADRVFNGDQLLTDAAVLIKKNKISKVGTQAALKKSCSRVIKLGDATILPGFIESHAHLTYQNVDANTVLKHGITTVRDVGGPLMKPIGGEGSLRLLSSGPIIQPPNGYPLNIFGGTSGYDQIGLTVSNAQEAEEAVQKLVDGGAAVIKISLEAGGEAGAPWGMDHGHGTPPAAPWALFSLDTVKAIVAKAHSLHKTVTAHIGENEGAKLALEGGVDEWSHVPCATIDEKLLQQAVDNGVKVVSTIDTLGSCAGIYGNVMSLANKMQQGKNGSEFIYGSEIAHDNVPWGINGQELHFLLHLTSGGAIDFPKVVNVIKSATSTAGKNLGLEPLGTLTPNAPADVIAVKGNAFERFKILEYPDLVISGGRVVVNNF